MKFYNPFRRRTLRKGHKGKRLFSRRRVPFGGSRSSSPKDETSPKQSPLSTPDRELIQSARENARGRELKIKEEAIERVLGKSRTSASTSKASADKRIAEIAKKEKSRSRSTRSRNNKKPLDSASATSRSRNSPPGEKKEMTEENSELLEKLLYELFLKETVENSKKHSPDVKREISEVAEKLVDANPAEVPQVAEEAVRELPIKKNPGFIRRQLSRISRVLSLKRRSPKTQEQAVQMVQQALPDVSESAAEKIVEKAVEK